MATTTTETRPFESIEMSNIQSHPSPSDKNLDKSSTAQAPEAPENDDEEQGSGNDGATLLKILSAGFSFLVAGCSDGSIGALIPYMIREYEINTAIVSTVFAASFGGWLFAAAANTHLSQYLDLGAMLALGALFQIASHALRAWGPPFGLFVVTFWLVCVGQAFQDTYGNSFVANVRGAHRWLGFIHAMYMLGSLIGPFVATAVASAEKPSRWYFYYVFPLGLGLINLGLVLYSFRDTVRIKRDHPEDQATTPDDQPPAAEQHANADASKNKDAMKLITETLTTPSVWLLSMFYFFYIGAALTASGWVVEYLVQVRHGDLSQMGYVPAGFNGGCLVARLLLAEPTHRFGEKRMVLLYCVLACAFQLVFWLVPNIIAASIAVSFVGFFSGPLFATGMSLGSKLFPDRIRPTALAFIFVVAQMGGSLFPIVTGVIASHAGVEVLQPILIALLVSTGISWLLVPRPKTANPELHQD